MHSPILQNLLDKIEAKKNVLDGYLLLPRELAQSLEEWYRVHLTYSSNALEGNRLSASETAIVLEKKIAIGGKLLKDHIEALNHADAFDYILQKRDRFRTGLSLADISKIHQQMLKYLDDEHAGRLRRVHVRITGLELTLAEPLKLQELIESFLEWLHTTKAHPVIVAADAHLKFVTIHPFVDGNGRTARLLMNLLLIQEGYPLALIMPEERERYIASLAKAQVEDIVEPFHIFIAECVEKSLDVYVQHASSTIAD